MRSGKIVKRKPKRAATARGVGQPQTAIGLRARGPELKCMDTFQGGTVNAGGAVVHLTNLAGGGDAYQRIGRQVSYRGVQVRAYFTLTGAAVFNDFVKMSVVYDRQPDGGVIAISDVYQNVSFAGVTTSASDSFTNLNNWDRFSILAEQSFPLVPENNGAAPPSGPSFNQDPNVKIYFNQYIPLKGMLGRWPSSAAGIPNTGAIFFLVQGLLAGGAINTNYIMSSRITYVDM